MTTSVLITADTHLELGARLPDALLRMADAADYIVHAGDATSRDVLDTLASLAETTAVCGNMDDAQLQAELPATAQLTIAGVAIAAIHIPGSELGRHERLRERFPAASIIVYGHTHWPELTAGEEGRPMIINPGSPTQPRRAPWCSACWIELRDGDVMDSQLVRLP